MDFDKAQILSELTFKAVLSSGPGGQHANKTSSRVILSWNLDESTVFTEEQKQRLQKKLKSYLTKNNILQLTSEETRSQHKNKEIVIERFFELLEKGLKKRKKRVKPVPGKEYHEKRLQEKRRIAEKKAGRRDPML